MKKIFTQKIPQVRKPTNSYNNSLKQNFISDSVPERKMLEFEFAHFSAAAVMRKTIEVIV